jgi:hypothetical protein
MAIAVAGAAREYALGVESFYWDAELLFKGRNGRCSKNRRLSDSIEKTQLTTEGQNVNPCRSF